MLRSEIIKITRHIQRSEFTLFKKFIIVLAILLIFTSIGCSSGSGNTTLNQPITTEDLAAKNNYSVGEFNKDYSVVPKNKQNSDANLSMNLMSIKPVNEKPLSEITLRHAIIITNAGTLEQTKKLASDGLFFEFYTEKGNRTNFDIKVYVVANEEGKSEIILNSDRFDLTTCKFITVGPVDAAKGKKLLFEIQS